MNASPDIEKSEYSKVLTEEEECKDPPQCEEGWKSFWENEDAGLVCLKNVGQVCSLIKFISIIFFPNTPSDTNH